MVEKLINEYVERMNKSDVKDFALKNGITLEDSELDLIYKQVKANWRTIIYGNPRGILDDLKSQITPLTYQKIESLYFFFRNKFQNYL